MIPPARVSDPVSVSGAPIARIVNGSPSACRRRETTPATPPMTVPGDDPDVLDRDRLGAGVAELVDQVLDAGRARSGR